MNKDYKILEERWLKLQEIHFHILGKTNWINQLKIWVIVFKLKGEYEKYFSWVLMYGN